MKSRTLKAMRPLGLTKTRFKVPGHGDCYICLHFTRKEVRRNPPPEYNVARTGRAREKNRRRRQTED